MDNFRDSYFPVEWDLSKKRIKAQVWGKQYDTGRGLSVTVISGGQVVTPTNEVLRLKWEKPDNTSGYVNSTIIGGKFIVENIDQMFTVAGSIRADLEMEVGGEFVASVTFYAAVEKAVAVDALISSDAFTALQASHEMVKALEAKFGTEFDTPTEDTKYKKYPYQTATAETMSYRQRRNRLPYTALNYQMIPVASPNHTIDGEPAKSIGVTAGGSSVCDTPLTAAVIYPGYIAFEYYAADLNIASIRMDIQTDVNNYFRIIVDHTKIVIGTNIIILNKSDATITGTPSWDNVNLIRVRSAASAVGPHAFRIGNFFNYTFKASVTIWFDDAHKTVYTVAKPKMDTYGMKGVQAIARVYLGSSTSYQSLAELAEMQKSGWEHCNHSYSHVKFGETTLAAAEVSMQRGLEFGLSHNFGKSSFTFVNPGGQSTAETLPMEKKYCTLRRIGVGYNKFPIADPYNVTCLEPLWETTPAEVQTWIDKAIDGGLWLVLLFHQIRPAELPGDLRYPDTSFSTIIDYLNTKQVAGQLEVLTCAETMNKL